MELSLVDSKPKKVFPKSIPQTWRRIRQECIPMDELSSMRISNDISLTLK